MKLSDIDINNIDFENVGGWPMALKASAIAVLCFIIVIAGYFLDTSSQMDELSAQRQQESELKQLVEIKTAKAANLEAYQQQMKEMERSFGSLLKQLPSRNEVAELLTDITQTGIASGLEFELFKPKAEIPSEFYAELPIELKVKGRYHEIGKFMGALAALPRIVTLHDFKIQYKNKDRTGDLLMEATAKTYRYLDEKEIEQAKLSEK
jgi:type IV pilus assembly protein PilO